MNYESETNGGQQTVYLRGRLSFADHDVFSTLIGELKTASSKVIIVDLSQLEAIDSAGLGMFILIRDLAKQTKRNLSFKSARGQVLKMLELSEFQSVLTLER